ncbi:MAG: hypothetical protein ACTSW1_08265 [Candidatus Hodarchaeales archaeon]
MTELKNTIEIIYEETVYISKKMNPVRRGLITKNISGKLGAGNDENDIQKGIETMAELFDTHLPETMWEFIKDDDKKDIGTYEKFVEGLDDKNTQEFLKWAAAKVGEINTFLMEGKEPKTTQK